MKPVNQAAHIPRNRGQVQTGERELAGLNLGRCAPEVISVPEPVVFLKVAPNRIRDFRYPSPRPTFVTTRLR